MTRKIGKTDCQIVAVSVEHIYQIIYKGPDQPEDKLSVLINVGDQFNACSFLKGHCCVKCEKGLDHDDLHRLRCVGKRCEA